MVKIVSFNLEGDYAAFRDPGVTNNQTVYVIPSKSAVIGLLGAILGYRRPNTLDPYGKGGIYTDEYLGLLKQTQIGMMVQSGISKFAFFTNHRSLEEPKTKPFKTELLISPKYTIFVRSNADITENLSTCLKMNEFAYTPILGHSYCLARINDFHESEGAQINPENVNTKTVILDDTVETNSRKKSLDLAIDKSPKIIVERHLHHFFIGDSLERRVLRHWIPVSNGNDAGSLYINMYTPSLNITSFYRLSSGQVICMY